MRFDPSQRLARSETDRWLGGVCGGIAHFLGWDPTLVRVIYIVVSLISATFPGILVYVLLWIIMPRGI